MLFDRPLERDADRIKGETLVSVHKRYTKRDTERQRERERERERPIDEKVWGDNNATGKRDEEERAIKNRERK